MWSTLLRCNVLIRKTGEQIGRNYGDGPPPKLLRKYEHFQKDNGVPIYLKGGASDKALFGLTIALVAVGLSDGLYTLFSMAFKKKK